MNSKILLEYKKCCIECKKMKSFKEFYFSAYTKDKLSYKCYECFKLWYAENREHIEKTIKEQKIARANEPKERAEVEGNTPDLVTIFKQNETRFNKGMDMLFNLGGENEEN